MASSVAQLPGLIDQFRSALAASEKVFQLLDRVPTIQPKGGKVIPELQGHIALSGVVFAYPSDPPRPLLSGLSLEALPNEVALVMGARGTGKSTVAALMQRLYDPDTGVVSLDAHDLRSLDGNWLRERVALVPQDPVLVSGTIAANIGYGADATSQTVVEKAARATGAHEWISSLPDGYQAVVGSKGIRLSASQTVQIAVARALAVDPSVLLVDDCLAALDTDSRLHVIKSIESAMAQRTLVFFTCNPELDVHATRLYCLAGGKAVSVADRDEMHKTGLMAPPSKRGSETTDTATAPKVSEILRDMEQTILEQPLEREKAMDLLELINEIKEAVTLESKGGSHELD
mmetsp:Transcript_55275/g.83632  ORF Transcript_55275/g.83632 Transcript_55275/m.83632 type:complete len:346 (-) Transcript_55275:7-1044(-)